MGYHAYPDRSHGRFWSAFDWLAFARPGPKRVHPVEPDAFIGTYQSGEQVRIRCALEILSTLDVNGTLDGVPFLSEMLPMIGTQAQVQDVSGASVVYIEMDHGQRIAWHTDWIAPSATRVNPLHRAESAALARLKLLASRCA